ncbi:hypothetical protein [Streptomyces sp. NBC_01718]|uniref:hypothetical protein n=1 Tax=Streptomyces sp. NBC_01718 TaxID=2975919 RepID=UPI00352F4D28
MVDDESEERSGPMSEKDVCDVYSYSTNLSYGTRTRTRTQQINYQGEQRGTYYRIGMFLTGCGLLGSVVVAAAWPWRREPEKD